MAYKPHYLLQFGGTLYTNEIWSCSLRMATSTNTTGTPTDAVLDDLLRDVKAFINTSAFNTQTRLTYVKFNPIGPTGHYSDATATYERRLTGTGTGLLNTVAGTASQFPPPHNSLAVSLTTARARGAGSRGRFYLPCPVAASAVKADDGMVDGLALSGTAVLPTAVQTFLNNLNNWPGIDNFTLPRLVVATPGGRNVPEGVNEPVTHWGIGRVVDTVRRRRNGLAESPQFAAVV